MDYVAFSGGIDSTALALLEPDAIPVFTDTGWEFPEIYEHLDHFENVTGRHVERLVSPKGTLPDYIRNQRYMPGHGSRYCTRIFKIDAFNAWLKERLPATLMIGLRADEPPNERVGNLTELDGLTVSYPLRERGIKRVDAVGLCIKSGLLPRYPPYMARGGCQGCFYKRRSEVDAMINLVPDVMDELQELEEAIQDERGRFALMFPNTGKSIREMRAQGRMFTDEELYAAAADNTEKVGTSCGLFCHR
jgi:hypothetical protein